MTTTKKSLRYAEAMERLQQILQEIDDSRVGIDELSDKVQEAAGLLRQCRELLVRTEATVGEALSGLEEEFAGGEKE